MIQPPDTETIPLSDFTRDATAAIRRLKESGQPEVLTIDGEPTVVVPDASSYQRLLDRLDRLETIEAIRQALDEVARGEDVPAEEVFAELRAEFGLPDEE